MRAIGFILVVLGALALGYDGFLRVVREKEWTTVRIPPVVGGIVLVSGLLVLAAFGRRGEN